jgi:hypothetical protein
MQQQSYNWSRCNNSRTTTRAAAITAEALARTTADGVQNTAISIIRMQFQQKTARTTADGVKTQLFPIRMQFQRNFS